MTAETGHVFVLSAGRRAALWLKLRHECSGVWGACVASSAVLRRRKCGEVLSWGFRRAKHRLQKRRRNLYAAVWCCRTVGTAAFYCDGVPNVYYYLWVL